MHIDINGGCRQRGINTRKKKMKKNEISHNSSCNCPTTLIFTSLDINVNLRLSGGEHSNV